MYCCLLFWNIWLSKYSWTLKSLSPQAFKANASSSGVELIKSISVADCCVVFVEFVRILRRRRLSRWDSWDPAEFLCQFCTVSFCDNFPQRAFVHCLCVDLWISKFRICGFPQRGLVGRFISYGCGAVSPTASAVSLNPWILAMNIC